MRFRIQRSELRVHRLGVVEFLRTESVVMQEQLYIQRTRLALQKEVRNEARVLEQLHVTATKMKSKGSQAARTQCTHYFTNSLSKRGG